MRSPHFPHVGSAALRLKERQRVDAETLADQADAPVIRLRRGSAEQAVHLPRRDAKSVLELLGRNLLSSDCPSKHLDKSLN